MSDDNKPDAAPVPPQSASIGDDPARHKLTSCFWPDLKKSLQSPSDWDRLELECGICKVSRLQIRASYDDKGVVHLDTKFRISSPTEPRETGCVLPCGHIFGHECINKYHRAIKSFSRGAQARCPLCETSLRYSHHHCNHNISGIPLPKDLESKNNFPLMIPEGGKKPEICCRCVERELLRRNDPEPISHRSGYEFIRISSSVFTRDILKAFVMARRQNEDAS
jgi:hypothetical protein